MHLEPARFHSFAMRFPLSYLAVLMALAPTPRAQEGVATVVVYVTVPSTQSSTLAAVRAQAVSTESSSQPTPSTFATLPSSSQPSAHSLVQATSTASATPTSPAGEYQAPGAGSGDAVDTAAGASGSDTASFNISKGGLAAIIIVVILVALFGSKSTSTP